MIFLIQIIKLLKTDNDRIAFIELFNDLSYEIDELGYNHLDDQMELVKDLLENHFYIILEDDKQLKSLTSSIIKNQGRLELLLKNFN